MPTLLFLTLLTTTPTPAPIPIPAPFEVDGSQCLIGFCPSPGQRALPPGVMFLATGLVSIGLHGLMRRRGQLSR